MSEIKYSRMSDSMDSKIELNIDKTTPKTRPSLHTENKVTLTWEHLDVNVPENNSKIAKFFKKKKSDQRSHIIQNGKNNI